MPEDQDLVIQLSLRNSPRLSNLTLVRKTREKQRPGLPLSGPRFLHRDILAPSPKALAPTDRTDDPTPMLLSRERFPRGLKAHRRVLSPGNTGRKQLRPAGEHLRVTVPSTFRHSQIGNQELRTLPSRGSVLRTPLTTWDSC